MADPTSRPSEKRYRKKHNAKPPILLSFRSSKHVIISTLFMASFTDTFLYSIVVPIFPTSLVTRAHVHQQDVQSWLSVLLAIYGAALLVAAPVTGYILDRCSSRKVPFLVGLITLIAGTAMVCVGNSIGLLLAGRVLSGASAAIVWTASAAMVIANFAESEIGTTLGLIALALNLGSAAGPILGGVVYDHGGYYAVFGMAFGVLGVDVILRILLIEKTEAAKWIQPEAAEEAVVHNVAPIDIGVDRLQLHDGELHAEETHGVVCKHPHWWQRLPPTLRLLGSQRILITILGSFVMALLLAAFETVLPLYVETEFHFSATGAGLIFIPLVLPSLFDPLIGHVCDKHPHLGRYIAAAGFLFAVPPLVLLRLVRHGGTRQIVLLCALLALVGLCVAVTAPPLMIEINLGVAAVEKRNPGLFGRNGAVAQGYGLFICAFAAGTLVGPLLAGFVKENHSWGAMAWVLGLVSGVTALPIGLWLGGWIGNVRKNRS